MRLRSQYPAFNDPNNPLGWKAYTNTDIWGRAMFISYNENSRKTSLIEAKLVLVPEADKNH